MFTLGVAFVSWKILHVTSYVIVLDIFTVAMRKKLSIGPLNRSVFGVCMGQGARQLHT